MFYCEKYIKFHSIINYLVGMAPLNIRIFCNLRFAVSAIDSPFRTVTNDITVLRKSTYS